MKRRIMDERRGCIWLQSVLVFAWAYPVEGQPGFLSIDCGSDRDYTDNTTGMNWVTDAGYISTGSNANNITVSTVPGAVANKRQSGSLRYFEENRSRDCYLLPTNAHTPYLVRGSFYRGNWKSETPNLSFDVYLNNTPWIISVTYTSGTVVDYEYYQESIVYSQGSQLSVCLVRGTGPSFISTLELRELASDMYNVTQQNIMLTYNSFRVNCGVTTSDPPFLRYPDDQYDRYWSNPSSWANATDIKKTNLITSPSNAPDNPPAVVMETAWIYYNSSILWFWHFFGEPVGTIYTTAYFQEIDGNASSTNVRGMTYTVNDVFIASFNASNIALEVTSPIQDISDDYVNMSFIQANWSKLHPILNAFELYLASQWNKSATATEDVVGLSALQQIWNLTDWTGDPCLPVPYDWLSCSEDFTPRITNLLLAGAGLAGLIPVEILNLTQLTSLSLQNNLLTGSIPDLTSLVHLQDIYLQNNSLSGNIPSFLAQLQSLTNLNLDNNNFSGNVPPSLLDKSGLNFTVLHNPDLNCTVPACGFTVVPPPAPLAGQSSSRSPSIGTVVGGILGGLVALAILSGIIWFFCTRKRRARSSIVRSIGHAEIRAHGEASINRQALGGSMTLLSLQEVSDATKKFSKKIGEGSFGPVYYGKLPNGQEVAVKVKSSDSRQGFNEFLNEVEVLSRIHHRNLVSLVGYCEEADQRILIYMYVPNGTLRDHLYAAPGKTPLDWKTRLDIALNSARGLEYLHTACTPRIIHRDVKSSNILLDENLVAKVADFGISRQTPEENFTGVSTLLKGTPGYFDPEYFITQRLTQKSDVYSFGVVLFEIISGRHPYVSELPDGTTGTLMRWVQKSVQDGKIMDVVDPKLKGEFKDESMLAVISLAMKSTDLVITNRPDMVEVVSEIKKAIKTELRCEPVLKSVNDSKGIDSISIAHDFASEDIQTLIECQLGDGSPIRVEPR